mmetsp:Transcript_888/g.1700  ORF Transcript_888/g.1700 Transcript_888/m.1700 type:complete len:535 (-) Transcript_888:1108-2712(-)
MIYVLREVVGEHVNKALCLAIVAFRIVPGPTRIQQKICHAPAMYRHVEAEVGVLAEIPLVQRSVQRGCQKRPGGMDRHPRAGAEGAAGPAGVHQPAGCTMLCDLLAQQVTVDLWPARHERRAETGRESRRRLGHAAFGAGHLGGEAGKEVVHRLRRCQPRDRGQDAEGVAGQHNDILGRATLAGRGGIRDHLDRVSAAHVRGQAVVVEVQLQRILVVDHVLDHGRELLGRSVDLRLCLFPQVDGLGVAATLEVEDPVIRPAMFVIADQGAARIGRERRLAGARKAEERRAVVGIADGVVGRAMHRHDAFAGQDVVEQGEDGLLVLARVFRVADQDQLLLEVQRDHRLGGTPMARRVCLETRAVDDGELGNEGRQLFGVRATQQVADEKVVPCQFGDHANVEPMLLIRAAEQVLDVVIAALHVLQHVGVQPVEGVGRHGGVVVPPDVVLDLRCPHDKFVVGRAAGELSGRNEERAALSDATLAALHGGLHQSGLQQVVIDRAEPRDTLLIKCMCGIHASMCHGSIAPVGRSGALI